MWLLLVLCLFNLTDVRGLVIGVFISLGHLTKSAEGVDDTLLVCDG